LIVGLRYTLRAKLRLLLEQLDPAAAHMIQIPQSGINARHDGSQAALALE
jgi:hypothetical protein